MASSLPPEWWDELRRWLRELRREDEEMQLELVLAAYRSVSNDDT